MVARTGSELGVCNEIYAPSIDCRVTCSAQTIFLGSCEAIRSEKRLELLPGANHGFTNAEDFRTMTRLQADWLIRHLSAERP